MAQGLLGCRISQKDGELRARITAEQGPESAWAAPDLREQDGDVQGHSGLDHRCFPGLWLGKEGRQGWWDV